MPTRRQTPFIAGLWTSCGDTFRRAFWPTRQPLRTWLKVALLGGVEAKVRRGRVLKGEGARKVVGEVMKEGGGIRRRRRRNVRGIVAVVGMWSMEW